jgi:hypothetical protein
MECRKNSDVTFCRAKMFDLFGEKYICYPLRRDGV